MITEQETLDWYFQQMDAHKPATLLTIVPLKDGGAGDELGHVDKGDLQKPAPPAKPKAERAKRAPQILFGGKKL